MSRRRKREGLPLPAQAFLLGSALMLRVWLAVTDQAPPVPAWFVLAAAVLFGGALGWVYLASLDVVHEVCRDEVNRAGWRVTITPTDFVYTGGSEPGAAIGIINYPRFPSDIDSLEARTLVLAEQFRHTLKQMRVSVVFPDRTVMLSAPETDR